MIRYALLVLVAVGCGSVQPVAEPISEDEPAERQVSASQPEAPAEPEPSPEPSLDPATAQRIEAYAADLAEMVTRWEAIWDEIQGAQRDPFDNRLTMRHQAEIAAFASGRTRATDQLEQLRNGATEADSLDESFAEIERLLAMMRRSLAVAAEARPPGGTGPNPSNPGAP